MTDNEIKKALECCKNDGIICIECPYKKANGCMEKLSADALDLINHLQVKLDEAEDTIQFADKELKKAEAENERLQQTVEDKGGLILINKAKAEAYKEFAERLKLFLLLNREGEMSVISFENIDNLLKELVGENND